MAEAVAKPGDDLAVEGEPAPALPAKKRSRGDPKKLTPWLDAVKRARVEWEARGFGKAGLPKKGTPFGVLCQEIYDRQSARRPS